MSNDTFRNVSLTYDTGTGSNLLGRLSSVTDASGTTRYGYDVQRRVISETKTIASETYITSYGYDLAGNLRSITYPTGQTVQYVADTSDPAKISGVKLNPAGANLPLAVGITYLPFGPASNMLLGNSVSIARGYDQNYRLSDVYQANGHTVMDQAYTLDDTGNITAITDDLDPTRSKSFGYDALARLTGATGIYGTLAYTYDKAGNRLTETKPGSQDTYDYFPYTSRLRSVTGTHAELIAYDTDGNITSRTPGAANPTPAVTATSDYVYNAGGQRVMKTKNGTTTVYHYDLEGRLIAETDEDGTMQKAYVWLNGEPLAMIGADGAVYYYHNDHLGTPQALTDQAVNLVWSADYLPFGQASVTTATVQNNLRFPGQYFDAETGLHYNWNRYYDTKLGRYITPDPIGLAGGVNLYSYVQNNPINFVDPEGLSPAGWIIKLTKSGAKKISSLGSSEAARLARKQGENVLAPNKQAAKAIERGAFGGAEDIIRHGGHDLEDGKGLPHFQTPGKYGHTFWVAALGLIGSLLDPFDAISGELGNPEEDSDGNGIPDFLERTYSHCP